jgi:hypothetical protein
VLQQASGKNSAGFQADISRPAAPSIAPGLATMRACSEERCKAHPLCPRLGTFHCNRARLHVLRRG